VRLHTQGSIESGAWRRLNFPLFVPPDGSDLLAVLAKHGTEQFVSALRGRADLGIEWAAAILAFLEFKGGITGQARLESAEQRCLPAALAGDAYAQYVLAWILVAQRQPEEAFRWMNRAASVGDFSPAWTDLGRFTLSGIGIRRPDIALGIDLLWSAHKRGHKAPLIFICDTYRRYRFGIARKVIAYLIAPFAILRYYASLRHKPFAQHVFLNFESRGRPFFRRT
jgi:TPR repeat protein